MAGRRPNILLIMSDEHDPAVTGCYGHPFVRTPHLDRLASEGAAFDNAYCNAPMCGPSRMSFLTGKYSSEIRVWDNGSPLRSEIPTFAHYFEAAGYDTVLCGRMHMIGADRLHGFGRRLYDDLEAWKSQDQIAKRTPDARRGSNSHVAECGPGSGSWQSYDATVADLTTRFLHTQANLPGDKPWLLVCGFMFPHFPLIAPQELFDLYWPSNVIMPDLRGETLEDQHPVIQHLRYFFRNDQDLPEDLTRRALASYYGLVTLTDQNVGHLLEVVDSTPLRENTVVIYASDHGEMAGQHGIWQKQCFYEPSVRVPLLIRVPGGKHGERVSDNVSLVDLMPTLLDLSDIDIPTGLAGTSLAGYLNGRVDPNPDRVVFSEYHAQGMLNAGFMIKKGGWKYVYYVGGYEPQLFNVRDDPSEFDDRATDPECKGILTELHEDLLEILDPEVTDARAKAGQLESRRRVSRGNVCG